MKSRRQRTDVSKYSFLNRTIKSCNQLPADLLSSFPSKLNTFRKRVKNVVTSKCSQMGMSEKSEVNYSDVEWTDVIYVKWYCFEVKWREVRYDEVLGDKITLHIMVTLYWVYLIVFFYLILCVYCNLVVLICLVIYGYVYVWIL